MFGDIVFCTIHNMFLLVERAWYSEAECRIQSDAHLFTKHNAIHNTILPQNVVYKKYLPFVGKRNGKTESTAQ